MKLALFGATGGTGAEILSRAVAEGHGVTALVRDATKIAPAARVQVVTGNVLTQADVDRTVRGADAVICGLGKTSHNPATVVSSGTAAIVDAMQRFGMARLIVISSLGVGDSADQVPLFFKVLAKTVLRKVMKDKERQEQIVRESGLAWTIVRPGGLTDGAYTGRYRSGVDSSLVAGQVARADVADFVLRELVRNEYIGKAPAIT